MDKRKLEHFKELLYKEKERTGNTIDMMKENQPNLGLRDNIQELSTYDNHPADIGSETFEMEKYISLKANEEITVKKIEKAIEKISKNLYGKCELCGEEIDEERLEVLPEAETCIECANSEKHTLNQKMFDRPNEEESLYPPFARTNMDGKDYTGFDGEDAWQAVAEFNDNPNDPSLQTGDNLGIFDKTPYSNDIDINKISNEDFDDQLPD